MEQRNTKDFFDKVEELVLELGKPIYCDIEVEPFKVKIDKCYFGLIPNKKSGVIDLMPGSPIAFTPPWDGFYDT